MNIDTKKKLTTIIKRTLFLFSVAFFIYSCDNDELDYDCESLQANIGDACDSAGVISSSCECVTTFIIDSGGITVYDCPALMLNFGDACDSSGVVGYNCECEYEEDSLAVETYDCTELMLDFGDSCWVSTPLGYMEGTVNYNCDCISDSLPVYDCPELMQNYGDSCVYFNSDSTAVYGIIDMNCLCN